MSSTQYSVEPYSLLSLTGPVRNAAVIAGKVRCSVRQGSVVRYKIVLLLFGEHTLLEAPETGDRQQNGVHHVVHEVDQDGKQHSADLSVLCYVPETKICLTGVDVLLRDEPHERYDTTNV